MFDLLNILSAVARTMQRCNYPMQLLDWAGDYCTIQIKPTYESEGCAYYVDFTLTYGPMGCYVS